MFPCIVYYIGKAEYTVLWRTEVGEKQSNIAKLNFMVTGKETEA
jgi:hypothetical protein